MSAKPVLLIGGHGVTGQKTARILRQRHPDLPLVIAGRDLDKAQAFAAELGGADALRVDLDAGAPNLGLPHSDFSAMAVFIKDETLDAMTFAGKQGIGFVSLSGGAFELGEEFIYSLRAGKGAPIVLACNWFAGAVTLPALWLAERFSKVDQIEIGIVIDRHGASSGPGTTADFKRILGACSSTLLRVDGSYKWVSGDAATGRFAGIDGIEQEGRVSVSGDVIALGAATGARKINILEVFGVCSSRQRGGPSADEITFDMSGHGKDGAPLRVRQDITAPRSEAPLTPIYVAMIVERLIGRAEGAPPRPGVYTPELILSPSYAVERMREAGVVFSDL